MKDIKKTVGRNIRKYRKLKKMTQCDIAYIIECRQNYISDIEMGKRNITIDTVQAIAKALNVDVVDLLKEIP